MGYWPLVQGSFCCREKTKKKQQQQPEACWRRCSVVCFLARACPRGVSGRVCAGVVVAVASL